MKNLFVVPLFMLLPIWCASQRITGVKLYGHFALNGGTTIPYFDENSNDIWDFQWIAPAVKWQKINGKYRELELTNLVFQRVPDFETDTRLSIGLRYEHGYRITKNELAPLRFNGGMSIRAYYAFEQLNGLNILGLPAENEVYGISLGITPHIEYRLNKQLIFDFSPYCEIANIATRIEYVYDPFIDEEQRQSLDFYFRGINLFFRVGIGWEF